MTTNLESKLLLTDKHLTTTYNMNDDPLLPVRNRHISAHEENQEMDVSRDSDQRKATVQQQECQNQTKQQTFCNGELICVLGGHQMRNDVGLRCWIKAKVRRTCLLMLLLSPSSCREKGG